MTAIKTGDTVVLKSGGPAMTVEKTFAYEGAQSAMCVWFDSAEKPQHKTYPLIVLEPNDGTPPRP